MGGRVRIWIRKGISYQLCTRAGGARDAMLANLSFLDLNLEGLRLPLNKSMSLTIVQ